MYELVVEASVIGVAIFIRDPVGQLAELLRSSFRL